MNRALLFAAGSAILAILSCTGGSTSPSKAGKGFRAPCPFHQERTPSFYVYPERQSWHCFGACATGGDIIAFVSKKESLDFQSTLRLLADDLRRSAREPHDRPVLRRRGGFLGDPGCVREPLQLSGVRRSLREGEGLGA